MMLDEGSEMVEEVNQLSALFDEMCQQRHDEGKVEYGALTWLENDVVRMMLEEMIDIANYCRFQFIKLLLMKGELDSQVPELGAGAFIGTGSGWKPEEKPE